MAHLARSHCTSHPCHLPHASQLYGLMRPSRFTRAAPAQRRCIAKAAAGQTDWDAVYVGQALPEPYAGPMEVQQTKDKGRGLFASRDVSAGELLLVAQPLVYMTADAEGTLPSVSQLAEALNTGRYTPHELSWLHALYAGDAHGSPGPVPPLGHAHTAQEVEQRQTVSDTDLDEARRLKIVELNQMIGDSDPAVAVVRGEAPAGYMGLWPEFSLFNHSCAPNAEWHTVQDRMIVRATRDVPKGRELTVSYLGPQTLRPAAERLMDLREGRDFACTCARCEAEMDDAYGPIIAAVHHADGMVTTDLVPNLQAALAEGGLANPNATKIVEGAMERLQPILEDVEQKIKQGGSDGTGGADHPELAGWLRASAYQAYSVQAQLLDLMLQLKAGAAGEQEAAAKLLAYEKFVMGVAGAVLPASDAQMLQAVKAWARAQQAHGGEGEEVLQAEARAMQVLRLRYGPGLKEETVTTLVQAVAASLLSE